MTGLEKNCLDRKEIYIYEKAQYVRVNPGLYFGACNRRSMADLAFD